MKEGKSILVGIIIVIWVMAYVAIIVIFTSCSSVKKSLSKQLTKTDSVSVSTSIIDKQSDLNTSKKVDSSGLTTKDKTKTWEREIIFEYDTLVGLPSNASGEDYIPVAQKIKRILIYEKGTQTKKETQKVDKATVEQSGSKTSLRVEAKDSTGLHKSETSIVKDKKKTGFSLLGIAVLFSVITIIGVAYWKRKEIKKKLFGA